MRICGLKLTHDSAVAVIENDTLLFSTELEKLNNSPRYSAMDDTSVIRKILADEGLTPGNIDLFVVDGWGGFDEWGWSRQDQLILGEQMHSLALKNEGKKYRINVDRYHERDEDENVLVARKGRGLQIGRETFDYHSYSHVTGHITSAYCTSPFAARQEDAFVLVWDGGMDPRLYYVNAAARTVNNCGPIFRMIGNIYTMFAQHFEPYKPKGDYVADDSSLAGKVMAYIARGRHREELSQQMREIFERVSGEPQGLYLRMVQELKARTGSRYPDADILRSFHHFLEALLVEKLTGRVEALGKPGANLCLTGGCALNIKWNSALRNTGFFGDIYVPPFPNDAGSAIGMAAAAMLATQGKATLHWSVYQGPAIICNEPCPGWRSQDCPISELAQLLYQTREPVVFLNGRAELGPRALGNRSIIACPQSPGMKDVLNQVKKREGYRPVSPMCREERAPEFFEPGIRDPYMLFDHRLKEAWENTIPAIRHLDGSARLQTISAADNPVVYELLGEFEKRSGVPILCNTSANLNGSGFFPDLYSATQWNGVNYVWCAGKLFVREVPVTFNGQGA